MNQHDAWLKKALDEIELEQRYRAGTQMQVDLSIEAQVKALCDRWNRLQPLIMHEAPAGMVLVHENHVRALEDEIRDLKGKLTFRTRVWRELEEGYWESGYILRQETEKEWRRAEKWKTATLACAAIALLAWL